MNILFVSSEFPTSFSAATGGIGTYLVNLTSGLINKGHKVCILTSPGKYNHKNIKVFTCGFKPSSLRIITSLSHLFFSLTAYFKIRKIIREQKIEIIEGNDFGGELFFYLLFSKKKPPVVIRLHTPSFIIRKFNKEPYTIFYRLMQFQEMFCLKKANSLYSPTRSLAQIIAKAVKRPIRTIIHYPFKPQYNFLNFKRKNNLVLYVGKLQAKKGVFLLTTAIPQVLQKFPNVLFYFVGPDTKQEGISVKNMLKDNLKKMKVINNVVLMDQISKRDLYGLYSKATLTVIPSIWENFPNVCLEAMSQGSTVIATKVGGLAEIIENRKNGLLIKPDDEKTLSQTIKYLIAHANIRKEISIKAISRIQNDYNLEKIIPLTLAYYSKVTRKTSI